MNSMNIMNSSKSRSSGKLTNEGKKELKIDELLKLNIARLNIYTIPLSDNKLVSFGRNVGAAFQSFIHPRLSPTLLHIAIQLTLENGIIIIIEYGQYYSEDSDMKNSNVFSSFSNSSDSSQNYRIEKNDFIYYYINKDGVRLTIIEQDMLKDFINYVINGHSYFINEEVQNIQNIQDIEKTIKQMGKLILSLERYILLTKNNLNDYIITIMACKHYKIPIRKYYKLGRIKNDFNYTECEIKNPMNLEELIAYCKGEEWEANNYNAFLHNCQDFAANIIKITKAVRIHNFDKIRTLEKLKLPGCIISQLWENEKLSAINTIGRIPIVGLLFDAIIGFLIK